MNRDRYITRYLVPVLLWMLIIFVSSSIPQDDFPRVEFWGWAKLIHLIYYGVLCFLCQRALVYQTRFPLLARHSYLLGLLIAVLYGATDEFHQLSTPGRHGQIFDVGVDLFGAFLFIAYTWAHRAFRPRVSEESPGK